MAVAMLGRLAPGGGIAVGVTFGLFVFMAALIHNDEVPEEEQGREFNLEITKLEQETDVITRSERPDEPDEVKTPPPPPRIQAAKSEAPQEDLASVLGALPEIQPDEVNQSDVAFVVADRDIQPLVRIPPQYPRRALERGTEGTCTMTLDVNPDGTTTNVSANCTSSVFERAAIQAVSGWKYQPKIENGQAVMRFGIQTDLTFELSED